METNSFKRLHWIIAETITCWLLVTESSRFQTLRSFLATHTAMRQVEGKLIIWWLHASGSIYQTNYGYKERESTRNHFVQAIALIIPLTISLIRTQHSNRRTEETPDFAKVANEWVLTDKGMLHIKAIESEINEIENHNNETPKKWNLKGGNGKGLIDPPHNLSSLRKCWRICWDRQLLLSLGLMPLTLLLQPEHLLLDQCLCVLLAMVTKLPPPLPTTCLRRLSFSPLHLHLLWESIATPGRFRDVRIYLDSVYK